MRPPCSVPEQFVNEVDSVVDRRFPIRSRGIEGVDELRELRRGKVAALNAVGQILPIGDTPDIVETEPPVHDQRALLDGDVSFVTRLFDQLLVVLSKLFLIEHRLIY